MNVTPCEKCGEYVYKVKTRRGKDLLLDTQLSDTYPNRWRISEATGKAEYLGPVDRRKNMTGYPSHYSTCKASDEVAS